MVLSQKLLYAYRLGGQTISAQDEITDQPIGPRRQKRWYMRWWAWILWIALSLIIVFITIGLWAWSQRNALLENLVIETLAEAGFDAELDITSVTKTQAQAKNIRLRREGQEVLRIETLRADYIWPNVRDGEFQYFQMDGAVGQLNLGEDWLPTDSWVRDLLPAANGNPQKPTNAFPEKGVRLTETTLNITSPLGEAKLFIDADIPTANAFTSEITLAPSDLSYGGYAAQGAGVLTLERTGAELRLIGQTQTATLSNSKLDVTNAHLNLDGIFDLNAKTYLGSFSLDGDSLASELFASGPARLGWDGQVDLEDDLQASGTWSITADTARSPRPARAFDVATTLSLFPALSVVPVTEHYAPEIRETILEFLLGSGVTGQGTLTYGSTGFTLNPVGDLSIESGRNQLNLRAKSDHAFYQFSRADDMIFANMNAQFEKPVGLTLTDIQLQAASENGVQLGSIQSFSANFTTRADWRTQDETRRDVRLGPLKSSLRYNATEMPRRLTINTALNYDGNLPGGYVEELDLKGQLDVHLYDGRQVLGFTPKDSGFVTIKSLETPTNWRGENISFQLEPTKNLFTRTSKLSVLSANLRAADFALTQDATETTDAQRLDLKAAEMVLSGSLLPGSVQEWVVAFKEAEYASETLPGPGTTASTAKASLTARLSPEALPQIKLDAPSVTAETPLARLTNIDVTLEGTPEAYTVEHTGGSFDIVGSEFAETAKNAGLASFPANGSITFEDEAYRGQAKLRVAKAGNAEVFVDYTYQNGSGAAEVDIPSILFAPKGLQPQTLIPAFRGKIARVDGEARAKLKLAFADSALTASNGTVEIIDMAVGTAPGPITGLNTTLHFTSLFPLETDGPQRLTMEIFNPGLPLEDGVVTFNLVPKGVEVIAADWPIGNGAFSLDPFTWIYAANENRVTMRVKDVALGDFLNDLGNQKIQATGNVVGTFPIVVRGIEVLVENGKVSVPDGGMITYDPGPNTRVYSEEEAIKVLRERRTNEYAALAQDALREFRYRELSASLDGPINGDVEIGLVFDGSNAKVLNRQPFRFDISVKGELFNIARSFNSNSQVKSEILRQNGKLPEGTIIGR